MNIFQIHLCQSVSSSRSFSTAKISLLGKPNYNCSVATSMETRSHITSQTAPAGVSIAWTRDLCIASFNRIPIESLKIRTLSAMHISKKFLAAIFSAVVCWNYSIVHSIKTLHKR